MECDTDFRTEFLNVFCWGINGKDNSSSCSCMCTERGFICAMSFPVSLKQPVHHPELETPNSLHHVWKERVAGSICLLVCFIWSLIPGEAFILHLAWFEFGEAIRSNECSILVCSLFANTFWLNQHPGRAILLNILSVGVDKFGLTFCGFAVLIMVSSLLCVQVSLTASVFSVVGTFAGDVC